MQECALLVSIPNQLHTLPSAAYSTSLLGCIILFSNWLDQYLQRFNFSFRQESKFGAKEHEMLEAGIEMRSHIQSFQSTKEAGINDSIDAEESSEDLPTKSCELGCLKDAQGLRFVIVIWELCVVVHLVRDPTQYFVYVNRSGDRHRFAVFVRPPIFHPRRKAFAGPKGVQVRICGHYCPNGAHIVVKINGVHRHPSGTRFTSRKRNLSKVRKLSELRRQLTNIGH